MMIFYVENIRYEKTLMGFETKVLQHPVCKHYCGYVLLPKNHRFYGKGYEEINRICIGEKGQDHLNYWLTYSDFTIDDYWCIGFDTAQGPYRVFTVEDTINEVMNLVELV
jgi:hypothetical protein